MKRLVTELDESGNLVSYNTTRKMRRSVQREIPFTPAPKTKAQKFWRNAVG